MSVIDMQDRELLELAARAAGYELEICELSGGVVGVCRGMRLAGLRLADGACWNPLRCDGDALRLCADLELEMYYGDNGSDEDGSIPCACVTHPNLEFVIMEYFREESGKIAATRRAVVLAAAEIGEQMPC